MTKHKNLKKKRLKWINRSQKQFKGSQPKRISIGNQWKDKDLSIKGKFLKVKISEKWKSVDIKPGVLLIKQQDGTHEPECKHVRQVTA